jgi:hypothetical protein
VDGGEIFPDGDSLPDFPDDNIKNPLYVAGVESEDGWSCYTDSDKKCRTITFAVVCFVSRFS